MAFPQTEMPVFVDIAPGGSPMGTTDSWDPYWVDITKDVRVDQKIVIEEGIPDEANQADPGSATMTLNASASKVASTLGRLGCYSTRNPLGPYYGQLSKNTPLRVRVQRGKDSFARTRATGTGWGVSESGIAWTSTTNMGTDGARGYMSPTGSTTAANAGSWDFDLTTGFALDVMPGAAGNFRIFLINFRRNGAANFYALRFDIEAGLMTVYIQRTINSSLTTILGVTTPGIGTVTANTQYSVRLKVEGGFIGGKVWNPALGSEPVGWNITTTAENAYTLDNTSLGTNIQFSTSAAGSPAAATLYWYPITINSYPFIGAVPDWPTRWDQSGNDSTTPLKATGVLRRLQQGKNPVKSPLQSFMDSLAPSALWMLEDESGATLASSQTPGVKGGTIYSSTPAGWNGPPRLGGTASQYTVAVDTTIAFTLPKMTITDRWLAWFAFYMPVLPVTNPTIFRIRSSGSVATWDMKVSDDFGGVIYIVGQAADGTVLVNQSIQYTAGQWCIGQMEIQQTGANFTGRIVRYQIGDGSVLGATSSAVAGKIGAPNAASIYGSTGFQASAAGPVAVYPTIPSFNTATLLASARGFAGEDAPTRAARLAAEKGIRLDLLSGGRSSLMGAQPADTFLNVMGETATTDLGLLTEFRGGLRYRTRGRRYNQTARMALDFSLGHIKRPPDPTDDDQRLRNDITATRRNGSSARAYDAASITANGLYDTSIDINPQSDDDLDGQVGFRLYLGTWDEMRWPSITLDLARNAGLANYIERATALDPGAYVTLANPPSNLPVGTVDLLVEGTKTTFGPFEWTIELVCQPYAPWRITDSSNTTTRIPRMDLVGSTLGSTEIATAVGATDTWTITNAGRSWNGAQVPFNWNANGEIVTVTALTGTSSQTATVTRGVNGITKAHVIGEPITLAEPLYVAL